MSVKVSIDFVKSPSQYFSLIKTENGFCYDVKLLNRTYRLDEKAGVCFKRDVIKLSDDFNQGKITVGQFLKSFNQVAKNYAVN